MTATRNSPGYPSLTVCSSYDKYYDNFKIYICWLVRADLQNRDTRGIPTRPTEVELGFGILKKNRDNPA